MSEAGAITHIRIRRNSAPAIMDGSISKAIIKALEEAATISVREPTINGASKLTVVTINHSGYTSPKQPCQCEASVAAVKTAPEDLSIDAVKPILISQDLDRIDSDSRFRKIGGGGTSTIFLIMGSNWVIKDFFKNRALEEQEIDIAVRMGEEGIGPSAFKHTDTKSNKQYLVMKRVDLVRPGNGGHTKKGIYLVDHIDEIIDQQIYLLRRAATGDIPYDKDFKLDHIGILDGKVCQIDFGGRVGLSTVSMSIYDILEFNYRSAPKETLSLMTNVYSFLLCLTELGFPRLFQSQTEKAPILFHPADLPYLLITKRSDNLMEEGMLPETILWKIAEDIVKKEPSPELPSRPESLKIADQPILLLDSEKTLIHGITTLIHSLLTISPNDIELERDIRPKLEGFKDLFAALRQ